MQEDAKANSLVSDPIPKLIRMIAVPASVGFFFNTMYNVTDTYFAGYLSTEALAALSLSFPVFFIIIALSSGISTGTSAILANALGSGNVEMARHRAKQALSFGMFLAVALTLIGLASAPALFRTLGAEGAYLETALRYINPIFMGAVFFIFSFLFNAMLSARGDTKTFRNVLIAGFFLNILLDPMFMFGWGPLPAFGIAGIAWATVIIECLGTLYMAHKVRATGLLAGTTFASLRPEKEAFNDISAQGFPAGLSMMTVAIGVFVITYFLAAFGQEAVAAYGIATRIEQIALLPMIGLNIAALTLVGQNNGARRFDRIRETISKVFTYAFWISVTGTVILLLLAPLLMRIFTDDAAVISIGVPYLRIAAFLFFSYGTLFLSDAILRGFKKPLVPLIMGLARQIVVPLILFSSMVFVFETGIFGIWWSIFCMVAAASLISYGYMRHAIRRITAAPA